MAEPSLSEVHADLVGRAKLDERLRAVEKEQAASNASLRLLLTEHSTDRTEQREAMQRMEARLTATIEAAKPKVWPAVSAIVAAVALILVVAQSLYTK